MNVFESVQTVLAVREYEPKSIPDETLLRIVEAGRLSGSSRNRQPWHFVLVDDPNVLNELAAASPYGPYIAHASAAIVVAVSDQPGTGEDASRAIQNMVLTAWSEGVGSNWVGIVHPAEVSVAVNLPVELRPFAILPLGYPATRIGAGKKKRKPVAEVASRNMFGNPLS
jgi:nitroreductase